jgi:hypothetical protein
MTSTELEAKQKLCPGELKVSGTFFTASSISKRLFALPFDLPVTVYYSCGPAKPK